jgi:lipoyl-dependent peroxiredoxin
MADINRKASAVWQGDSRSGKGKISTDSGVLNQVAYNWNMRFENEPGTNPEELIAAAHAGCFSMAFASMLSKDGFTVENISTQATCVMTPKPGGGMRISKMRLETQAKVPGIDEAKFQEIAAAAKNGCPVSSLLAPGLDAIEFTATRL